MQKIQLQLRGRQAIITIPLLLLWFVLRACILQVNKNGISLDCIVEPCFPLSQTMKFNLLKIIKLLTRLFYDLAFG